MQDLSKHLNFDQAVNYHYGAFPPAIDQLDLAALITPLTRATDALARFDQMLKNLHNSELLMAPLRNQEAVLSSRMEGTISTIDEVLRYEADFDENNIPFGTKNDTLETLLYQRTLKYAQTTIETGKPISQHLIRELHQGLLFVGRGADKTPGRFKTEQNYLVDKTKRNVRFTPISPESLPEGLENLIRYMKTDTVQALIKTAVAHLEFEALHPFKDGNGRIGRMLITLMLWDCGVISSPHFYISRYFEENKDAYIDTMREVSKSGDWTSWCLFFMDALEQQAINNLAMAEDIQNLYTEMKTTFREILTSKYHDQALDFIFTTPVFRNNSFTQKSGIPESTAHSITKTLLEHGIISLIAEASGRRAALYSFEPLLQLVRV